MHQLILLRIKTGRPSRTRTCDLPLIRRMHSPPVLSVGGAPRKGRTRFSALQERRIASNACGAQNLEPAERIERSSDAYRAPALPLSYTGWSRRADSNRHLSFTRAPFFPLNYFDMERVTGFEPVSGPWQGPILAARRYPHGASGKRTWCALIGSRRTLCASLEGWNPANKSHSIEIHGLTVQLSKNTLQRQRVDG